MKNRTVVALSIGTLSVGLCLGLLIGVTATATLYGFNSQRDKMIGMINGILINTDCREAAPTINKLAVEFHLSKNDIVVNLNKENNESGLWQCGIITWDMVEK